MGSMLLREVSGMAALQDLSTDKMQSTAIRSIAHIDIATGVFILTPLNSITVLIPPGPLNGQTRAFWQTNLLQTLKI